MSFSLKMNVFLCRINGKINVPDAEKMDVSLNMNYCIYCLIRYFLVSHACYFFREISYVIILNFKVIGCVWTFSIQTNYSNMFAGSINNVSFWHVSMLCYVSSCHNVLILFELIKKYLQSCQALAPISILC